VAERLHTVILHVATAPETPALTGSSVVHLPLANASWICFYFIDYYLYAGSNDIKFIRQALW
jgi:hypothetical protein